MRLGVEAAVVDGVLVLGRRRDRRRPSPASALGGGRGRGIAVPGFVDLQVNGFAGVDFTRADAAGYRRAGEALLETRRDRVPADADHRPRGRPRRRARRGPAEPRRAARDRRPPRRAVPLAAPPRRASGAARRDPDPALLERLLAAGPVRT